MKHGIKSKFIWTLAIGFILTLFDFKWQRGGLDCGVFFSMDFNYLNDDLDISYPQNDISAFRLHNIMANAILRELELQLVNSCI